MKELDISVKKFAKEKEGERGIKLMLKLAARIYVKSIRIVHM